MWQRLIFIYLTALAILCICIETSPSETHKPLDNHDAIPGGIRVKRQSLLFTIPRVFREFYRVIKETRNDTQSAVKQISDILSQAIVNTPTTQQPPNTMSTTEGTAEALSTTTERFTVSRDELLRILRRNYRGLVRLFNQEVDIALNDSNFNVAVARAEFRESLRQALLPVTTTTTTTTTSTTTESIVPRLGGENS